MLNPGAGRRAVASASLALTYFLVAKLGLSLAIVHASASAVWPATGLALAAFLLAGPRCFPAVLVGAFAANVTTAGSVSTSLAIAVGNSLEGWVGALLVQRFAGGAQVFDRVSTFFRFTLFSAVGATAISPTVGVASLALGGFVDPDVRATMWLTWWLGDVTGAIVFTPLIVLCVREPRVRWHRRQLLEALALLAFLVLVGGACFGPLLWQGHYPLTFLPVAMLIWAGFRFQPRETAFACAMMGALAIWGTRSGYGPFAGLPDDEALLMLQLFVAFVTGMALTVAIVVAEGRGTAALLAASRAQLDDKVRERTEQLAAINRVLTAEMAERLQAQQAVVDSEATFRGLVESAPDALLIVGADGSIRIVNSQAEQLFGYDRAELLGQPIETLIPERFREQHVSNRLGYTGTPRPRAMGEGLELYGRRKNGSEFSVDISLAPLQTKDGPMVCASVRDVTRRKRAEIERRANERLRSQVEELSRRTREISTLAEMGDMLRAASSVQEVHALVPRFLERLCPGDVGTMYVFHESRAFLEPVAVWGGVPAETVVRRDDCWALRLGRPHRVDGALASEVCPHVDGKLRGASLCIPMVAQGESLGLLHLRSAPGDEAGAAADPSQTEYRLWLAQTATAQIAGALASATLQQTLREHASRDPLTNLLNRRSFDEALAVELHRTERRGSRLALLMVDLDHFKRFNDRFGHVAGDVALREIAALMVRQCRKGDLVCRHGGEETTIALVDCTATGARQRARRLQEGVRALRVEHEGRQLDGITLSIGIAVFPDHGKTADDLLRAADKAVYSAKAEGRNCIVLAARPAGGE